MAGHVPTKARATVFHASLWGRQEDKYAALETSDVLTTKWRPLAPKAPSYLFVPRDEELLPEYEKGWKVTDIFPVNVLGFQTHRDHFAVDFDEATMKKRVEAMRNNTNTDEMLVEQFNLKDNRDWKINTARNRMKGDENWQAKITLCDYRPFDRRFCYFDEAAMDYPRRELLRNVVNRENLCLAVSRQQASLGFRHVLASKSVAESCFVSNVSREGNQIFPLYLYSEGLFGPERRANLSTAKGARFRTKT